MSTYIDTYRNIAHVHCYDERMQIDADRCLSMNLDSSDMLKLHDEAYGRVLHTQEHNKMGHRYARPTMKELPVQLDVCACRQGG
jgi:hypothetical protein